MLGTFTKTQYKVSDFLSWQRGGSAFSKRALFFSLFAVTYDALFGIGSALKRKKQRPLPRSMRQGLIDVDREVTDESLPERVAESLARRTTHPESRKSVVTYLKRMCGIR